MLASVQRIVLVSAKAIDQIKTQTTKGKITPKNLPVMLESSEELPTEYPVSLPGHKNCCCPSNLAHPMTRTPSGYFSFVRDPACISKSKQLHPKAMQGSMKSLAFLLTLTMMLSVMISHAGTPGKYVARGYIFSVRIHTFRQNIL